MNPEQETTWTDASKIVPRYVEVFDAKRELALRHGFTERQAADHGQVAAWLDKEALAGRLKIMRSFPDGGRTARHTVLLLEEKDGVMSPKLDIGGWRSMAELRGLHERYMRWLYNKDEIVEGYFRVNVMITDNFPDHEMFKRYDGSPIDLGFIDCYIFTVDIPKKDLIDAF